MRLLLAAALFLQVPGMYLSETCAEGDAVMRRSRSGEQRPLRGIQSSDGCKVRCLGGQPRAWS